MTLPLSGPISMTMITNELLVGQGSPVNIGSEPLRGLAEVPSGTISFSDFYGKENFTFPNGGFELGTLNGITGSITSPTSEELSGWVVYKGRIRLNGVDSIEGYPTPTDTSYPASAPSPAPGDNNGSTTATFSAQFVTDKPAGSPGTRSIELKSTGNTVSYGIVHGPYLVSAAAIELLEGYSVDLWWRATGGGDAYDAYAYMLNMDTGATITMLNATGGSATATTPWTNFTYTIGAAEEGNYKFVFIAGTYDFTGGQVVGATLLVDDILVSKP